MTPLERAARALYQRKPTIGILTHDMENPNKLRGFPRGEVTWEEATEEERGAYLDAARAVIEAIREPSTVMLQAAEDNHAAFLGSPIMIWHQMIDAMLAEAHER